MPQMPQMPMGQTPGMQQPFPGLMMNNSMFPAMQTPTKNSPAPKAKAAPAQAKPVQAETAPSTPSTNGNSSVQLPAKNPNDPFASMPLPGSMVGQTPQNKKKGGKK